LLFFEFAIAIPSKPTCTSVILVTPFLAHSSTSLFFIRRDALVISGVLIPLPEQNNFKPPPEPVDSILGVLNLVFLPKVSATTDAKG